MKRLILNVLVGMVFASGAMAGGWANSFPLAGGAVALTNSQANTVWEPVAVLWKFALPTNALVVAYRVSQGSLFTLGLMACSNSTSVIWIPEAGYPFAFGDVLQVTSSVTNGVVQIIRKGE